MKKHRCVARPTMFLASLDIKTAFDDAKPKHVANVMDRHGYHGWQISSVLREVSGLQGNATFEQVDTSFTFNRCLRQESIEALKLWQMMAMQIVVGD